MNAMYRRIGVTLAMLAAAWSPLAQAQTIAPAAAEAAQAASQSAATADANAAVKELLAAMHYRELMAGMFRQMAQTMPSVTRQVATQTIEKNIRLTPEQRAAALARLDTEIPRIAAMTQSMFNDPGLVDELEGMVAPIYTRYFSAAEIRQIAAFYRTDTGAKMVKVMPQIASDSMQLSQQIVLPRIMKMVQQSVGDGAEPAAPAK